VVASVGDVREVVGGQAVPVVGGAELAHGSEIVVGRASHVDLALAEGPKVRVGAASRLLLPSLAEQSRRDLGLHQGEVDCVVPKLAPGLEFAVRTPDARVVVHGTAFSVRVQPGESSGRPTRTCVRVREGLVGVESDGRVYAVPAGQHWGCEPKPTPAAAEPIEQRPSGAPRGADAGEDSSGVSARRARPARGDAPSTERVSGTLDAENRLFERALREEREGDRDAARATLEELLRDYPKTPLAPDARRALGRLRAPRPTP
jgi:hypothetical protein